jgi:cytochrome c5
VRRVLAAALTWALVTGCAHGGGAKSAGVGAAGVGAGATSVASGVSGASAAGSAANEAVGEGAYARKILERRCQRCHALPDPRKHTWAKWERGIAKMKRRIPLPAADWDSILALVEPDSSGTQTAGTATQGSSGPPTAGASKPDSTR